MKSEKARLVISLGLSPRTLAGFDSIENTQLVFCSLLELDRIKSLLSFCSHILVNLNDLAKTEPLDAYTLRTWRESFADLVAQSLSPEGIYAQLWGYTENGDWNMAKLGIAVGVRDLYLAGEIAARIADPNHGASSEKESEPALNNLLSFPSNNDTDLSPPAERGFPQNAIPFPVHGLEGSSKAAEALRDLIRKCAAMPSTVIITGESGVGKKQIARALHDHGKNPSANFVVVACVELKAETLDRAFYGEEEGPSGFLNKARGGTLYLEGVDSLGLEEQGRLIPILKNFSEGPQGRIVASTRSDLAEMCRQKRFREDLYFRLSVIDFVIPPLRQRRSDLEALCEALLGEIARKHHMGRKDVSAQSFEKIYLYEWPGNILELKNALEHGALLAQQADRTQIEVGDLPLTVQNAEMKNLQKDSLREAVRRFEREHIQKTLAQFQGSKESTADALGLSLATLYRKLGNG